MMEELEQSFYSTEDLKHIIRQLPFPMYISSNDPARLHQFIEVNDALVEHIGYTREELGSMMPFDLVCESFFQKVSYDHQETLRKRSASFESLHRTKDGKQVPVDVFVRIVELQSGELVNVVQFYETSQKQETERLLERVHQQLESLFEFNPDFTFMMNEKGYFTNVNPAGVKLLGYTKRQLQLMVYTELIIEEDSERAKDHFRSIFDLQVAELELRIRNQKGDIRLMDVTAVPILKDGHVTGIVGTARDITDQKAVEKELLESRQRYHSLFENNIDAVATFDLAGCFLYANPAIEQLLGFSSGELIGKPFLPFIVPERQAETMDRYERVMNGKAVRYETAILTKSNEVVELHITVIPIIVGGVITGIHCIGKDITEKKNFEQKLNDMAFHDYLTKLPNQHYFQQFMQKLSEAAQPSPLALLFLDLDRFKSVNDAFGHDFGDLLLVATAKRLTESLPSSAHVFRYGGDELIIILEGAGKAEADQTARQIIHLFEEPFVLNEIEITTSTSIGISLFPHDGENRDTLIKKADHAMYIAKRSGKQQYRFYHSAEGDMHDQYFKMEPLLKKAIRRQELSIVYQPQVNLHTCEVHGVEALLRWNSAEIGFVSPAEFIPIAEESGLIVTIGEWVIRTACLQMNEWQQQGMRPVKVSVNVSIRQFYHTEFVDMLQAIIEETGIDPRFLELEITESIASSGDIVIGILQQLKELGVHVSIDDFGTGYSSLRYLREFPIDCLKIDQSFMRDLTEGKKGEDIVSTIITLAHNLDLITVAEGTETKEQVKRLKALGCDVAQGYYFSRPLPPEECLEWMKQTEKEMRADEGSQT